MGYLFYNNWYYSQTVFPTMEDHLDPVNNAYFTGLHTEIENIENAIGLNPTGAFGTIAERLDAIPVPTDRGDPAAYDLDNTGMTLDNAYHDWDLSSIISAGAKVVFIKVVYLGSGTDGFLSLRTKGNSNTYNDCIIHTQVANVLNSANFIVFCDVNGIIQYAADSMKTTSVYMLVTGWL